MKLEYVPLLQIQRDLYRLPRGYDRFREYLRTMTDAELNDLKLPPLVAMNPMGKEHLPALLDALLALDADAVVARAVAEAEPQLAHVPGEFKIGLAIADDLKGGWTNRYSTEFSLLFETKPIHKRKWLSAILWSNEAPSVETTRVTTLTTIFRAAYIQQYGFALTLREMLAQEGYAMAMAGCTQPVLDEADLAYTREIMAPHKDAKDRPTVMACLFGDVAAHNLGYPPQGLSPRAGLALALHEAKQLKSK
jgi:hypothetical protein